MAGSYLISAPIPVGPARKPRKDSGSHDESYRHSESNVFSDHIGKAAATRLRASLDESKVFEN